MRTKCFHAALAYLDRDWAALALCPPSHAGVTDFHRQTCQSPGKRPLAAWKAWQGRLPMIDEVVAQWDSVPEANVGVVLGAVSRLIGIDIDGPAGRDILERIGSGDLPETQAFATSRGLRLLYAIGAGMTPRTWAAHEDGSEVRVMGQGSLTVMPPSLHVSYKRYRWLQGHGPGDLPLALAPAWTLRPREVKSPRAARLTSELVNTDGTIPEGRRNETLFRIACALRGAGARYDELLDGLARVNTRCRPPLPDAELRVICRSALRYPRTSSPSQG